jgi:hypothetical protein
MSSKYVLVLCVQSSTLLTRYVCVVEFALTQAGYTIMRLLQRFNNISLLEEEKLESAGVEQQVITLAISIQDGCKVNVSWRDGSCRMQYN